jgi:hypothetical protein
MTDPRYTHGDRHSEHVGLKVGHPGPARNRVPTVHGLARLGFEKPDLDRD